MRISKQLEPRSAEPRASELKASRKIHPEDILIGDNVAVSMVSNQYASFHWFGVDTALLPPDELVQLTFYPCDPLEPLTVHSVCLPFVLCKQTNSKHVVLDVRRTQLVRLDPDFAKAVRKALKRDKANARSKKKSNKKKAKPKKHLD